MGRSPCAAAEVAKLVAAATGHVVAALLLLHHRPALLAPLEVHVRLQELDPVLIAVPLVPRHHTLQTVLRPADDADHRLLVGDDVPLTVFVGAQSLVVLPVDVVVDQDAVVLHLLLEAKLLPVNDRILPRDFGAAFLEAADLPEEIELAGDVSLETVLAESVFADGTELYEVFMMNGIETDRALLNSFKNFNSIIEGAFGADLFDHFLEFRHSMLRLPNSPLGNFRGLCFYQCSTVLNGRAQMERFSRLHEVVFQCLIKCQFNVKNPLKLYFMSDFINHSSQS